MKEEDLIKSFQDKVKKKDEVDDHISTGTLFNKLIIFLCIDPIYSVHK